MDSRLPEMRTETTRPYYVARVSIFDGTDGESRECMSMEMTYDTDDTGHNDRDGTLHHEIRSEDGHGGDSDTRLGSPVAMRAVNGQWCCSLCLCV